MITIHRNFAIILLVTGSLLLLPLLAMQFTTEVNWSLPDFLVMGTLLIGTGLVIERVLQKVKNTRYRLLLLLAAVAGFLLIWAELAVGILGTPLAGS